MATYKLLRPIHLGLGRVLEEGELIELDSPTGVYANRVELVVATPDKPKDAELEVATPSKRTRRKNEEE